MQERLRDLSSSGQAESLRVSCRSCGNSCRPPGEMGGRTYLCPRCRAPLRARVRREASGVSPATASAGSVAVRAGLAFLTPHASRLSPVLSRLAPIGCVLAILLIARQAVVMPASEPARAARRLARVAGPPPVRKPYSATAERNYRFRVRQLESDLARDPREYLLFARLGQLHARLAGHAPTPAQADRDLQEALEYFQRAASHAQTRRDYDWATAQRQAYSDPGAVSDETDGYLHPDLVASPPPRSEYLEDQLQLRAQFLEMLIRELPQSARLRCRLGLTYVRLSQALRSRSQRERFTTAVGGRRSAVDYRGEPYADVPTADGCRRRAREELAGALRLARSREVRAECYRALAELYRAGGDPISCLGMLRRVVELQPNNWPAQLHVATLLTRLGRPEEARRARALGERWRTPEWM
jgi:tetratricopeptide (TPR) repeat protein